MRRLKRYAHRAGRDPRTNHDPKSRIHHSSSSAPSEVHSAREGQDIQYTFTVSPRAHKPPKDSSSSHQSHLSSRDREHEDFPRVEVYGLHGREASPLGFAFQRYVRFDSADSYRFASPIVILVRAFNRYTYRGYRCSHVLLKSTVT